MWINIWHTYGSVMAMCVLNPPHMGKLSATLQVALTNRKEAPQSLRAKTIRGGTHERARCILEVSINGGVPKWMVYVGKCHSNMDALGVAPWLWKPPFIEQLSHLPIQVGFLSYQLPDM